MPKEAEPSLSDKAGNNKVKPDSKVGNVSIYWRIQKMGAMMILRYVALLINIFGNIIDYKH